MIGPFHLNFFSDKSGSNFDFDLNFLDVYIFYWPMDFGPQKQQQLSTNSSDSTCGYKKSCDVRQFVSPENIYTNVVSQCLLESTNFPSLSCSFKIVPRSAGLRGQ